MQIHRLRLVNFRQHEDTDLVLGAGLTGIVGPNGAGKSTLLEAIAFAMYGTPAARGTRDSIRRRGAPPRSPVRVEMEFALGAHEFRVVRGLSQAELFQDGDPAPIANSLGAVTEKLSRLLGMTREEFFNTYFTGQKEIAVMARMSGPERAQFLSRVLGYERLRVAQDRLRETRSQLRVRLQTLQAGLPDPAELGAEEERALALVSTAGTRERDELSALQAAEARVQAATPRWTSLQGLRTMVQSLEADIRLAEHQVTNAQERNKVLDREITEALQAQAHLAAIAGELTPLPALRAEREALERLFAASTHRATLHAQLTEVRASLAELDQRLAALPTAAQVGSARAEAEARRAAAAALATQAEERRIVWVRDLQDAETKRQALRDQYKDLHEQLERIRAAGPEGACPTCSRPLGKDFEAVVGVLSRQVEEVLFNGNFYKQRIEQLEDEPADLQGLVRDAAAAETAATAAAAELSRLEAPLRDAGTLATRRTSLTGRIAELEAALAGAEGTYDPERHDAVKRQLAVLEPRALEAERYRAQADRAARLAPELLAAEKVVSEREDALAALRRRREELEFSEEEVEVVRAELEAGEAARRSAELRVVEARGERSAAEEAGRAVARRKAERDARAEEVRGVERELLLAQELDRALTDLRTDLNAALRPDLSDLASGFLRELTKGRYTDLELDEDYTPALLEDGEVKPVISGGEEDVANLALRLAISQMIAERAGQPLSLLVLDEVFGSLDEERRGAVMDLLRGLADRFPQVILITHIEAVREGFDRLIRIDRDPARRISVVSEAPLGGGGRDVAA